MRTSWVSKIIRTCGFMSRRRSLSLSLSLSLGLCQGDGLWFLSNTKLGWRACLGYHLRMHIVCHPENCFRLRAIRGHVICQVVLMVGDTHNCVPIKMQTPSQPPSRLHPVPAPASARARERESERETYACARFPRTFLPFPAPPADVPPNPANPPIPPKAPNPPDTP